MKNKRYNTHPLVIILLVLALLAAAAGAAGCLLIRKNCTVVVRNAATGEAEELTALELFNERESLRNELVDAMNREDELNESIAVLQGSINDLKEELEDTKRNLGEAVAREEEEAELYVDALEAGTVVESRRVKPERMASYFQIFEIREGDPVYYRIFGRSYRENPNIALGDLRYLKVLHYNFDHEVQVGELVVNAELAADFCAIFRELFEEEYEIESMYLIDNYWTGDGESSDSASIDENNTSAFCYREVTGGASLSNHAYGRAIDLNPQQNPYVSYASGSAWWYHRNADQYVDRTTGLPHVITHDDTAYRVFTEHGFEWGGDWAEPKDYQHFEKK